MGLKALQVLIFLNLHVKFFRPKPISTYNSTLTNDFEIKNELPKQYQFSQLVALNKALVRDLNCSKNQQQKTHY